MRLEFALPGSQHRAAISLTKNVLIGHGAIEGAMPLQNPSMAAVARCTYHRERRCRDALTPYQALVHSRELTLASPRARTGSGLSSPSAT
eukprot:3222750-Rhodomonas_salina.1